MHYVCYTCEECNTNFAIQSLDDRGGATCPNCDGESTDTGEVIVNPNILGVGTAKAKRFI